MLPDMDISGGDFLEDSTTITELNNGSGITDFTAVDENSSSVSGGDSSIFPPHDDSPYATAPPVITLEDLLSGISFEQEENPYYFSTVSSGNTQLDNSAILTELTGMNDRLTLIISFLVLAFIWLMGKCIYKFFSWFF